MCESSVFGLVFLCFHGIRTRFLFSLPVFRSILWHRSLRDFHSSRFIDEPCQNSDRKSLSRVDDFTLGPTRDRPLLAVNLRGELPKREFILPVPNALEIKSAGNDTYQSFSL